MTNPTNADEFAGYCEHCGVGYESEHQYKLHKDMRHTNADELELILIRLIDQVTEGDGEPLTDSEVAFKALAKAELTHLIGREVLRARIEELRYWPLNWALNRKDEVWEKMIRSRLDRLSQELNGGKHEEA